MRRAQDITFTVAQNSPLFIITVTRIDSIRLSFLRLTDDKINTCHVIASRARRWWRWARTVILMMMMYSGCCCCCRHQRANAASNRPVRQHSAHVHTQCQSTSSSFWRPRSTSLHNDEIWTQKFSCFWSDPVELTGADCAWPIADTDSVLCTLEDHASTEFTKH